MTLETRAPIDLVGKIIEAATRHRAAVAEAQQIGPDRVCVACHVVVPEGRGVYWGAVHAVTHRGECNRVLAGHRSSPRRSTHRWRSIGEAAALAEGTGCSECQKGAGTRSPRRRAPIVSTRGTRATKSTETAGSATPV